jgi:hypothetical protein
MFEFWSNGAVPSVLTSLNSNAVAGKAVILKSPQNTNSTVFPTTKKN